MTRRTLLVPLFAAGLILAPSEIAGKMAHGPAAVAGSAAILAALDPAGWKPALPALGSSADTGRTGLFRWSTPPRAALGPQDRSA